MNPNMVILYFLTYKNFKIFYAPESPGGESTTTVSGVNYQLVAVILLKWPNEKFLVAVDHNQLRTMSSETVYSIDWRLPSPFTWQYPIIATCTVQIGTSSAGNRSHNLRHTRQGHCLSACSGYTYNL